MKIEITKTLILTQDNGSVYKLNVGDIVKIKTKKCETDIVQITAISEKSISVGSYLNPIANPMYIKLKDIEMLIDIYNDNEEDDRDEAK